MASNVCSAPRFLGSRGEKSCWRRRFSTIFSPRDPKKRGAEHTFASPPAESGEPGLGPGAWPRKKSCLASWRPGRAKIKSCLASWRPGPAKIKSCLASWRPAGRKRILSSLLAARPGENKILSSPLPPGPAKKKSCLASWRPSRPSLGLDRIFFGEKSC